MSHLKQQFGEVYDKYVEKIYRFVYLKVNSQEVAEDLTSEVFTKGWESINQKKCDIKNIQAFLYQIARNLVVDHYRQKGQAQLVSVDAFPIIDEDIDLEKKMMQNSDLGRIRAALADIKDEYREIIIWYYLDEFSAKEIAKILNKSEQAVRVQIHRALRALKTQLG